MLNYNKHFLSLNKIDMGKSCLFYFNNKNYKSKINTSSLVKSTNLKKNNNNNKFKNSTSKSKYFHSPITR